MHFRKVAPKIISYTDYNKFDNSNFLGELRSVFTRHGNQPQHALCKKQYMRGNSKLFMTKTLSKEIMQRIRLRKRFLKNNYAVNKKFYYKQRNLWAS